MSRFGPSVRSRGLVVLLVALAGAFWLVAHPVHGQAPGLDVRVQDAELEYAAALSEWESALNAFRAAEARWQRALDEVQVAEASGDEDAYRQALGRFHTQAVAVATQEARERDTAARLEETRLALMDVLALSRDAFYEAALEAGTAEETRELAALYEDRANRYRELERSGTPPGRITSVTLPEIAHDPRDGPEELDGKIKLLELRIREIEAQIEAVDERIGALEKRQRQERDLQNLMAGVERFDDTFVPVTSPDPLSDTTDRDDDAAPTDSMSVSLDDLTLGQQIEGLRLLREQMFERRGVMERRLQGFRQRLLRMTT